MANELSSLDTIYDHADACVALFNRYLRDTQTTSKDLAEEQCARFSIWASNVGVFASVRASLDYRLRDSPDIQRMIVELLVVIRRNIERAMDVKDKPILRATTTRLWSVSKALHLRNVLSKPKEAEKFSEGSSSERLHLVEEVISSLQRVSSAIRKSAAQSRNLRAANFIEKDDDGCNISPHLERQAIRMVQYKFNDADRSICELLGISISLRRNRFLYRRRHQAKLASKRTAPRAPSIGTTIDNQRDSNILPGRAMRYSFSKLPPAIRALSSHKTKSQRSVALSSTIATAHDRAKFVLPQPASMVSSVSSPHDAHFDYPPAPILEIGRTEVDCPYCLEPLAVEYVKDDRRWRRHVDNDIEPYVCLFGECKGSLEFYSKRDEWMAHMQQEHTTEWRCTIAIHPSQRTTVFHKKEDFENHMNTDHAGTFNSSQLPLLVERCAVPANRPFEKCPICNRLPPYIEDMEKKLGDKALDLLPEHIAGHLKAIAFMFLPPIEDDRVYGNSDDHEILEDASNQPSLGSRSEISAEKDLQRPRSATEFSLSQYSISSDEVSSPNSFLRPDLNREEHEEIDWSSIPWKQYPKIEEDPKFLSSQMVKKAPLMTSEAHTLGTEKAQTHQEHRNSRLYAELRKTLRGFSWEESQSISFGRLHWLWKEFPRKLDLEGKVGNPDDPGDGLMYYESDVHETTIILREFYEAWSAIRGNLSMTNPLPKVGQLTSMAKICLVLGGMKQEKLLDYFCEAQKTDIDLPLSLETAKRILYNDPEDATTFAAEQYRAVRRDWEDGEHIKIAEEEPLPLVFETTLGMGAFSVVRRYRDAFESVVYAVKEQIVDAIEEQQKIDARSRPLREIGQLKVVKHRHIAQFVKSYQRGSRYGLLIRPAATTDLRGFLARYKRNGFDYDRERIERKRDREILRPIMLTAFGCLSRGLSCIHAYQMRHKDIRPENILYEEAMSEDLPARFLWTDFGPSHLLGATNSNGSRRFARQTMRYAAPELRDALREVHMRHDTDEESDSSESDFPDSGYASGRSMDIFSFGCAFLEILSTLTDTELPRADSGPYFFRSHMPELQAWAQTQKDRLDTSDSLRVPFALAIEMIRRNPEDRPTIDRIVEVLADTAAAKEYFCLPCLQEIKELRLERGRDSNLSVPAQVIINGAAFSKYECEICCAIKLYIRDVNNAVPSDDTLGYIINSMRGEVNGSPLPCQNIIPQIQRHSQEQVRSIYMSVYVNKSFWGREANRVYNARLKYFDTDSSGNPELRDHSLLRKPIESLEPPPTLLIDP